MIFRIEDKAILDYLEAERNKIEEELNRLQEGLKEPMDPDSTRKFLYEANERRVLLEGICGLTRRLNQKYYD